MTSLKDSPKTEHQFRDGREDQILFLYKQGGAIPSPGNRGNHLTFSRAPCRRAVSSGSRALELRGNDPGSLGRRAGQPALLPGEPSRAGGGWGRSWGCGSCVIFRGSLRLYGENVVLLAILEVTSSGWLSSGLSLSVGKVDLVWHLDHQRSRFDGLDQIGIS